MRALLTGATGFVGHACVNALLAKGFEVHAVTRHTPPATTPSPVQWHVGDLLEETPDALLARVRPTHLLHAAWYAAPGRYWTGTDNLRWVAASLELIRAFQAHGGQRVVVTGSCAEYDWTGRGDLTELTTERRPATLYGVCKDALHRVLARFASQTGLSYGWAHLFFMYGPGEQAARLVPSVITGLLDGERPRCTAGTQVRDFLHVADVADALGALLASNVQGPVNVASGQPVTVREVVETIERVLGSPGRAEFGALPTAPDDPARLTAATERLFAEVGWQPRYGLEMGLRQTIDWARRMSAGARG